MQGVVLCAGVGGVYHIPGEMTRIITPRLMDFARETLSIDVKCYIDDSGLFPELHPYLQKVALDRWSDYPLTTIAYAMAKLLHLLGFSLRGPADYGSAAMSVTSISAAAWLIRRRMMQPLGQFYFVVLGLALLQSFVFQPDQRFRVAWVDFLGVWTICAAVIVATSSFLKARRPRSSGT